MSKVFREMVWEKKDKVSHQTRNIIIGIVLIATIVGGGYAITTVFFSETAPVITTSLPALSGCSTLTATPANIPTGGSGGILFTCGTSPSTLGALSVNSAVTASFSFSPTPTVYTAIYVIPSGTQCASSTTSTMQIFPVPTNPTTMSFGAPPPSQFDYCGIVNNAPSTGIPSWAITWTWTQ